MKASPFILLAAAALMLLPGCGILNRSQQTPEGDDSVNIGYGNVRKQDNTSSVSTLKMENKVATAYSNMYEYLNGRVPGVQVTGNKIIIRGISTNSSQTDPLLIVDGIEVPNLDNIDPADVESVDVIKDGSSAIYGFRGANGVILITTKRKH